MIRRGSSSARAVARGFLAAGGWFARSATGRLDVWGAADVRDAFRDRLREHRASLLAGPCMLCHVELADAGGGRCAWCTLIAGREVVYRPGSAEERAFLDARAAAS